MESDGWRTIDAVETGCRILSFLETTETAGVTEISDAVDRSPSAVHAHLATLKKHELVSQSGTQYRISTRVMGLAEHVKALIGNYGVIQEEVDELAREIGEVAQFAVEEHGWVVYMYKQPGQKGVETASAVGKREYLHSTALGKALLSQLPENRVDEIVERRGLPGKTSNTLTDRAELDDQLAETREREYAIDDEENARGIRCIATPVYVDAEQLVGAISITGPASRMTDDWISSELPGKIDQARNIIEINSKYS